MRIPTVDGIVNPLGFERTGAVQVPWKIPGHKLASQNYAIAVANAVKGAKPYENRVMWTARREHPTERQPLWIEAVLDAADGVRDALADLIKDIKKG
ncbi:MAG: hypothetical protein NT133_21335 [Alphaproteobacteria bacterium]|nr:hypothetical protein [Alphaproteobacteria bacterium]